MKLIASMICLIVWFGHTDSRAAYVYSADVGDTVTLSCPERSQKSVTWYGPPNYMPYRIDGKTNPILNDKKIAMVGDHSNGEYNLEIIKVSSSNQGNYRCRLLNNGPVEYEIFLMVKDKPTVVKEITEKHTSFDNHEETTTSHNLGVSSRHNDQTKVVKERTEAHSSYDNHDKTTSSNNSEDSSRHNDGPNESRYIILCIVAFIAMFVIVTCISIGIRKYYRNKYRKQNPSDDDTTHNYDEIESDLSRGVTKIDSQIITGNIALNGIIEDILNQSSDTDTNTYERNYTNCQVQVSKEASLHATHCKSETDAITVYLNETLTGNSDHEDPDIDLHLYEPIGEVQVFKEASSHVPHCKSQTDAITVYLNDTLTGKNDREDPNVDLHLYEPIGQMQVFKEASLHVPRCKGETDAITVYLNDTLTGNSDRADPDVDLHLYEPIGQVQVFKEACLHVTYYKSLTGAITVYQNETGNEIREDPDNELHLYEPIEPEDYLD